MNWLIIIFYLNCTSSLGSSLRLINVFYFCFYYILYFLRFFKNHCLTLNYVLNLFFVSKFLFCNSFTTFMKINNASTCVSSSTLIHWPLISLPPFWLLKIRVMCQRFYLESHIWPSQSVVKRFDGAKCTIVSFSNIGKACFIANVWDHELFLKNIRGYS